MSSSSFFEKVVVEKNARCTAVDGDSIFRWVLVGVVLELRFGVNIFLFGLFGFDDCASFFEELSKKKTKGVLWFIDKQVCG